MQFISQYIIMITLI